MKKGNWGLSTCRVIKIEGKEYVFCERRYRQVGFDKRDRLFYGSALLILVWMAYSFVGKSILDQNIRQALKNVEETSLILIHGLAGWLF